MNTDIGSPINKNPYRREKSKHLWILLARINLRFEILLVQLSVSLSLQTMLHSVKSNLLNQHQSVIGMHCYTVRPLFKMFTQHCETYEPTNCCVKKIHKLCKIVHNLCKIVHKLCNFFYTTVGRFICFTVLCKHFKQWSNSVVDMDNSFCSNRAKDILNILT